MTKRRRTRQEAAGGRRRRKDDEEAGGRQEATDIKSNNPHLAGGEKQKCVFSAWWFMLLMLLRGQDPHGSQGGVFNAFRGSTSWLQRCRGKSFVALHRGQWSCLKSGHQHFAQWLDTRRLDRRGYWRPLWSAQHGAESFPHVEAQMRFPSISFQGFLLDFCGAVKWVCLKMLGFHIPNDS